MGRYSLVLLRPPATSFLRFPPRNSFPKPSAPSSHYGSPFPYHPSRPLARKAPCWWLALIGVAVLQVHDDMTSVIVAQLLYLESQSVEKPIYMYINSPGGVVTAGLAIYDTMQFVKPPISTLCIGQACSMGSLLLAAGEPGMRQALPNSRIMIHQPSGGFQVCNALALAHVCSFYISF